MGKAVLIAFFIGLIAGAALVTVIRRRRGKSAAAAGVAPNPLIKEALGEIEVELKKKVKHATELKTALEIIERVRKRRP